MESLDTVSKISLFVSGCVLAIDIMDITLPNMITKHLANQMLQIVLGIGVIVSSCYHLPTAIILASVLYLALNQKKEQKVSKKTKEKSVTLNSNESVNNTGVPGMPSDPDMEPVENPLPTQDNSAPEETATQVADVESQEELEDLTLVNKENLDKISGFGGNDMAPLL